MQPIATAYPTFIRSLDLLTEEAEAKFVLHPTTRLKTSLSYQWRTTEYRVGTATYIPSGSVISPGGSLAGGTDRSQIFSINTTLIPISRLLLSTTFSYQTSTSGSASDNSPAVVPYRGNIYTIIANGTYVLSQAADLFAGCAFSAANYGEHNLAGGLPLGIQYQKNSLQAGFSRRLTKNISGKLQYRFDYYSEPSSGGATGYRANSIFGLLSLQFP